MQGDGAKRTKRDRDLKANARLSAPQYFVEPLNLKAQWAKITTLSNATYQFATRCLWVAIAIVVIALLHQKITEQATIIDPISVPRELADRGYTSEVAARRLRDSMRAFSRSSKTHMQAFGVPAELPTIVVPTVGVSLDAVAFSLRKLLNRIDRKISGEIIVQEKLLWAVLRIDGREIFRSRKGTSSENFDDLFRGAAESIFEETQPYLVASAVYNVDRRAGLEKARSIIARLDESDLNVAWAYNLIGSDYRERYEYEEADKALRKALKLSPSLAVAHTNLGNLLKDQYRYIEATLSHREAIRHSPEMAVAYSNLAGVLLNTDVLTKETEMLLGEVRKLSPNYALASINTSQILEVMRRGHDEAVVVYRTAIKLDRDLIGAHIVNSHIGLGDALKKIEEKKEEATVEYQTAEQICRNAIADNPNDARMYVHLATALARQGREKEALVAAQKAVSIDPLNASAHVSLGFYFSRARRYDEAITAYRRAIEIQPKHLRANFNLGLRLHDADEHEKAIAAFRKVIEVNPRYPNAHYWLGLQLAISGRRSEAISLFREAIKIDPRHVDAYQELADELLADGQYAEALATRRKVREIEAALENASGKVSALAID